MSNIHLGIIPDGNRRWCKKNNVHVFDLILMLRNTLYNQGQDFINKQKPPSLQLYENLIHIKELSIYILSKDNLIKRDDDTLNMIRHGFKMLIKDLKDSNKMIQLQTIKIQFVGEMHLLPVDIQEMCQCIEQETINGTFVITAAIAYDPIEDSRKFLLNDNRPFQGNIDLVVRTGGEKRSSGFYPLHVLYSEWIYLDMLWPDATLSDLNTCIGEFLKRERRFGK
jgi:undecaprenyl pyrophosphate synthase